MYFFVPSFSLSLSLSLFLSLPLSSQSELEEFNEMLELKEKNIAKVQEKETAVKASFKASLGQGNKFEEFLTKVFKKKIKRVKEKEQTGSEGTQV